MKKKTKRNPALVELILVILFFSLSSVLLVQLFAKAKRISDLSHAETLGNVAAQSLIEKWKADPQNAQSDLLREGWTVKAGESCVLEAKWDQEMNLILEDTMTPQYSAQIVLDEENLDSGSFYTIRVEITRIFDQTRILSLTNGRYVPDGKERS